MKTYQTIEVNKCNQIQCDKCGKVAKSDIGDVEFQEFTSITRSCGYGSGQDDGSTFEVDLCQYCVKELLGSFWKKKVPEEKPTWDSFFDNNDPSLEESNDFYNELEKIRDSQLPIGTEPRPGLVRTSKLGRHFLELSDESVKLLEINAGNEIDISVGNVAVTLWKK